MKERYEGLDGLRTYSILGIAFMHIMINGGYSINSVAKEVISPLGNLVYIFIIISAFAMCCGYYDSFKSNSISLDVFYTKRYKRIWPFFALLCLIDVLVSPSVNAIFEGFANLTLVFSLLPNSRMGVIGVGWTLGVIFLFYILFPFFVYVIGNKRRAWVTFVIAFMYNLLCRFYFDTDSSNILYMAVYFITGGLIYLYRKELRQLNRIIVLGLFVISIVCFYFLTYNIWSRLFMSSMAVIYAIGVDRTGGVLINPFTKFISSISFEIYLCHMLIFRVIDKIHLTHIVNNGMLSYVITCVGTILGSVIFSVVTQWGINKMKGILIKV